MQIRCGTCHGTVWVQMNARTKSRPIVQCHTCSQEYDLSSALQRVDIEDLHQDALVFAENRDIDIQAARSVLLGIMSLDEASDGCESSFRPSEPPTGASAPVQFDSAFKEAVEAGHLTPAQAKQRGARQVYAERIAARHALRMGQALAVADNRISLLEAVRARKPKARIEVKPDRPGKSVAPVAIALAAMLAVVGFFALTRALENAGNSESRPASARTELTAVEVRVDLQGELTEVSGQNPASVLAAYCESMTLGELVPVGLVASDDGWTGLYQKDETLFALTIRRDPRRDLWVVGDAVEPIQAERSLNDREPEDPTARRQSAAWETIVVKRNARGTVVHVVASDPVTVIRAYCQFQTAGPRYEPLELRAGIPAEAGVRVGVFRGFSEEAPREIAIRREQKHRRWIAGDGSGPIEVATAREAPPGAYAVPVGRSLD